MKLKSSDGAGNSTRSLSEGTSLIGFFISDGEREGHKLEHHQKFSWTKNSRD